MLLIYKILCTITMAYAFLWGLVELWGLFLEKGYQRIERWMKVSCRFIYFLARYPQVKMFMDANESWVAFSSSPYWNSTGEAALWYAYSELDEYEKSELTRAMVNNQFMKYGVPNSFLDFFKNMYVGDASVHSINAVVKWFKEVGGDANRVSDSYHTFGELYRHRVMLYICLCSMIARHKIWRSKLHSDGTFYDGWFLLGVNVEQGQQITYHLPMDVWNLTNFAVELEQAPEYDGHTSEDVLERLQSLIMRHPGDWVNLVGPQPVSYLG
jgi:hypothetical protein